jgi:zeaxanthin glucosyltransferase
VLSSARLDFPRDPWPDRCYAGPCLTDAAPQPWSHPARRPGVPLVYCAFGGQAFRYPRVRQFLELLAEVVAHRNIDVILAADEELVRGIALPPAIHRLSWAPQRSILQGADLFITHGGLSSIKEAVWEGVPMLVVPQAYDQHGNAARVVFHGLGDRIVEDLPTAPQLATLLDGLLTSGPIKSAAGRMKELLRQEAMEEPGLQFVTELMAGRPLAVAAVDFERLTKRISWQTGLTTERS